MPSLKQHILTTYLRWKERVEPALGEEGRAVENQENVDDGEEDVLAASNEDEVVELVDALLNLYQAEEV